MLGNPGPLIGFSVFHGPRQSGKNYRIMVPNALPQDWQISHGRDIQIKVFGIPYDIPVNGIL
jgi:hypothetical protein